ncbi:tumor necrosis factor receptor superfamily member 17 isoform X2 [Bufo bufo]|uniref:tumor necrosis factor receptor superfamily member 17 isoform X2 n=1 Tax=Bufo bufo TaxID=8384 RepID=UPI001ABDC151|nr:tumor necrosis factor receptor superfamily member 17 isoform X2 [Bufo bufo]
MGKHCPTSQYYDELLQSCKACNLRCGNLPPGCLNFNLCTSPHNPEVGNNANYTIWLVVLLIAVLISTIIIVTIMLHRKRKLHADSFGEACGKSTTKSRIKGADLEQASCDELKKPVAENEDVDNPVGANIYDNALSDYLFPLPAVEEGAAILVTTKTSACLNPGPGVRGDAFVEI